MTTIEECLRMTPVEMAQFAEGLIASKTEEAENQMVRLGLAFGLRTLAALECATANVEKLNRGYRHVHALDHD